LTEKNGKIPTIFAIAIVADVAAVIEAYFGKSAKDDGYLRAVHVPALQDEVRAYHQRVRHKKNVRRNQRA